MTTFDDLVERLRLALNEADQSFSWNQDPRYRSSTVGVLTDRGGASLLIRAEGTGDDPQALVVIGRYSDAERQFLQPDEYDLAAVSVSDRARSRPHGFAQAILRHLLPVYQPLLATVKLRMQNQSQAGAGNETPLPKHKHESPTQLVARTSYAYGRSNGWSHEDSLRVTIREIRDQTALSLDDAHRVALMTAIDWIDDQDRQLHALRSSCVEALITLRRASLSIPAESPEQQEGES